MSAGVGAGGAAMTVNPGVSFGANAMAAPQTFSRYEPPPNSAPQQMDQGTGGSRGAGGAYDLRAWEKEDLPEEDGHACLGMDVGTSSIKVRGGESSTDRLSSASISCNCSHRLVTYPSPFPTKCGVKPIRHAQFVCAHSFIKATHLTDQNCDESSSFCDCCLL